MQKTTGAVQQIVNVKAIIVRTIPAHPCRLGFVYAPVVRIVMKK